MIRILIVKDANLRSLGVLDRAFAVSVNRRVNSVWQASFSLPIDDDKAELATHLNYVDVYGPSGRSYGLYRIVPSRTRRRQGRIDYECEHVISTLLDDVMDGYFQYTNMTTKDVLADILAKQTVKRWKLGDVDITRYFHYKFENENGLLAPILSVPKPFDEPYEFEYDTSTYPWTLHLRRPSDKVTSELRWGRDMRDFDEFVDPSNIVNYIIPKGAGEGVNQLTIADVNNGVRYLKDDASIAKWGRQSYIWVDRRFEDAESLKASAQALLDEWKEPRFSFEVDAVDLTIREGQDRRLLNGVTAIYVGEERHLARIIGENIKDLSKEYDVDYEIANRISDVASIQADIERKQQINDAYSQGATNIMTFGYQDNADANIPAVIPFYIDDDVVNVNTCELTFRTNRFRAYSEATGGGGATVTSTKSGGGSTATSSSGGGTTATSSSGGGTSRSTLGGGATTRTASTGGSHTHDIIEVPGAIAGLGMTTNGSHSHNVTIPSHTHDFSTPNHTHNVTIQNHTHTINIPSHTHEIELPNHTHDVLHKIVVLNEIPGSVTIKVDGNTVPHTAIRGNRINLIDYIAKDAKGKIQRGRHEVEILPAGRARIEADLILRVFIQSHIGNTY